MEAVIFALIGTRNERFVPESAEFQPFDLRALRHSYNAEDNSPSRPRAFLSGIAEDADGLRAQLFCLLLELVEPLLAPRREHQSRALFGQGTGASLSDAGACAGD